MKKEYAIIIGICLLFLGVSLWLVIGSPSYLSVNHKVTESTEWTGMGIQDTSFPKGTGYSNNSDTSIAKEVAVYICGEVKNPGFYRLTGDSRVYDAILAAGGLKKSADKVAVNQARILVDGEQIEIPKKGRKSKLTGDSGVDTDIAGDSKNLININQAKAKELMNLPGIGESKAAMILEYRETNGSFTCIEDIMNISGIKEGVFNKIKQYITI